MVLFCHVERIKWEVALNCIPGQCFGLEYETIPWFLRGKRDENRYGTA